MSTHNPKLFQIFGIVVCGLAIGGIGKAQLLEAQHLFTAILVLTPSSSSSPRSSS